MNSLGRIRIRFLPRAFAQRSMASAIIVESFGGPEVLKLGSKALPPLGPGQVRVDVRAAGVNPSDTYVRLGPHGPWAATPHLLPTPPFTPGKDGAGVVTEVGSGVSSIAAGQRVYLTGAVTGTYASEAVCDAGSVHALPDNASFEQGACVGVPCATAYHALKFRARTSAGQRVFIHGASGAVGLAAVQLAKGMGCFVVGTAGTAAGLDAVAKAGADAALNHREEGYVAKCQELAPDGYNVILEMAAHANLPTDLKLAGKRSCVCIIGSKAETVAVNPRDTMPKEIDVRGVFLSSQTPDERREMHSELFEAMSRGTLLPVIGMRLPLGEAAKAHVEVMAPSSGGAVGNIVLLPSATCENSGGYVSKV
eukprot:TRINITY_DN68878_c0_g1_i1.p1 TRINITY_DN68878_c0_g1~~TRINITY_DN68878_c0_g1_i1.p1  ORF type:complete len:366 (+),score=54.03 TRINITY_DN68878_c0_g1_i1:45-1142(+)